MFILLLVLALSIVVIYTSATVVVKTTTIDNPSFENYEELYADHLPSLVCPCTKISTSCKTFIDVKYSSHEVCSSIYITTAWLEFMDSGIVSKTLGSDFRVIAPMMFQALRTICGVVDQSISGSLSRFYLQEHVDALVVPRTSMETTAKTYVEQFMSSTTETLLTSLRVVRDAAQINALLCAKSTNFVLVYDIRSDTTVALPRVFDDNCT